MSILQLRGKEVLVSAYDGYESSPRGETASSLRGVSFWNINDYTHQHTVTGYSVYGPTSTTELSTGNIALSSKDKHYPIIVIIDSSSYQIVTMIQLREHITFSSSLCVFDEHSFIYVYDGTFLQISSEDGKVLFHSKGGKFDGWHGGIIPLEGGKYFAIENGKRISIIKPCYA